MNQKPGMFRTRREAARVIGLWLVLGAGCWAVIIGLVIALVRAVRG